METKPRRRKSSIKDQEKETGLRKPNAKRSKIKQVSTRSILMGDDAGPAVRTGKNKLPRKKKRPSHTLSSSDEEDSLEVDVTTPLDSNASLSVSLKKNLIQLDTSNTFDTARHKGVSQPDTGNALDVARHHHHPKSLLVSINKGTLSSSTPSSSNHTSSNRSELVQDQMGQSITFAPTTAPPLTTPPVCAAKSPSEVESYKVEFTGTKMIFRSSGTGVATTGIEGVSGGGGIAATGKKCKKKHKKKAKKRAKLLEREDVLLEPQDTAGNVQYTNSLKVKIKL